MRVPHVLCVAGYLERAPGGVLGREVEKPVFLGGGGLVEADEVEVDVCRIVGAAADVGVGVGAIVGDRDVYRRPCAIVTSTGTGADFALVGCAVDGCEFVAADLVDFW